MYANLEGQFAVRNSRLNRLVHSVWVSSRTLLTVALVAAGLSAGGSISAQDAGYMRMVTSSGRQVAGESTDPAHNGWIPLRRATMPSASEIAALAQESSATPPESTSKSVHRPVVLVKDRDSSSLGLLGAMTSHQQFPEVDIVLTKGDDPVAKYKLTDVTVISVRGGGTNGGTDAPEEQLRLNYAKIELEH
ncbi:MAG TPA: type VI secretion system tube protein Hcp [Candidatus Baltobacteraceae bacterium]|nr:type VI secretion system tube protein Hcp [Candidatus Baltobacteraceae bacterium]